MEFKTFFGTTTHKFPAGSWTFGCGTQEWSQNKADLGESHLAGEVVEAVNGVSFLRKTED